MNLRRFFRNLLEEHPALNGILQNIHWLALEKILRLGLGLVVTAYMARTFGPTGFGQFHFALAYVMLFAVFGNLGLVTLIPRELVRRRGSGGVLLGTTFTLQCAGGLLGWILVSASAIWMYPDEAVTIGLISIIGFSMIFRAGDFVRYYFESETLSRKVAVPESILSIFFSVLRVILLYHDLPLTTFAWLILAEIALTSLVFILIFRRHSPPIGPFRFSFAEAKFLLSQSWPLLLSAGFMTALLNLDKVMLSQIIDTNEVGIYTAASRITESTIFLPLAIGASVASALTRALLHDSPRFYLAARKVLLYSTLFSLFIAIPLSLFSPYIIQFLYGEDYSRSAILLAVQAFTLPFIFQTIIRARILTIQGHQSISLCLALLASLSSFTLNLLLIPTYGALGCSIASLLSWMACANLFPLIFHKSRYLALPLWRPKGFRPAS